MRWPLIIALLFIAPAMRAQTQHGITLSWTAEAGVDGYNVYESSVTGGPYTKLNVDLITGTSWFDARANDGKTHYYVVTAVTYSAPPESGYSTEASATADLETTRHGVLF